MEEPQPIAVLPQPGGRRISLFRTGLSLEVQTAGGWGRAAWIPAGEVAGVYRYRTRNWNYLGPAFGAWTLATLLGGGAVAGMGPIAILVVCLLTTGLVLAVGAWVHPRSLHTEVFVDTRRNPLVLREMGDVYPALAQWIVEGRAASQEPSAGGEGDFNKTATGR